MSVHSPRNVVVHSRVRHITVVEAVCNDWLAGVLEPPVRSNLGNLLDSRRMFEASSVPRDYQRLGVGVRCDRGCLDCFEQFRGFAGFEEGVCAFEYSKVRLAVHVPLLQESGVFVRTDNLQCVRTYK